METLLLVDGSSYLYRAFHALPDLRSRNNEPTGAIHGVLSMLRRLHKDYHADYSACVFDAKGKTFRDEIYPEYKAHRPKMPHDLAVQIEPLYACIRAMGWPMLIIDGVEADDVIGTLAKRAVDANMRCIISTGDKDIAQLVNSQITLVNTMNNEMLDEANVLAKFGVPPTRMLDYLMLVGDASDNIPGVEKVGPKTAAKWLAHYGSLANIIAHADEIKGVVGDNLRKALGWFDTTRQLITIKCDLDLPIGITDLTPQPQDISQLVQLYERLDMKASLRELRQQMANHQCASVTSENDTQVIAATSENIGATLEHSRIYQTILTESELSDWLVRLDSAQIVSIDSETTSLNPLQAKLVGI